MYKIGIAIMLALTFSCGRSPGRTSANEADSATNEEESVQSTLFTENSEFFIEYGALVKGEESGFLVHVTQLQTYKPYMEGLLTIEIDGVSVKVNEPARPGIFEVPFTPVRAGEFHVSYTLQSGQISETVSDHVEVHPNHQTVHPATEHQHKNADESAESDGHQHSEGEELHEDDAHHESHGEEQDETDGHHHDDGEEIHEDDAHHESHGEEQEETDGHHHDDGEEIHEDDAHHESHGEETKETDGHHHSEGEESHGEEFEEDGDAADAHDHAEEGEIIFLKEQAWSIEFMVKEIVPEAFSSVISTSGEIMAMPGEKKNLAAVARGTIIFSEQNLVQGSGVEKGQHLFTIRGMSFSGDNVELKYQEYKISLLQSRRAYERHKELYASRVISEKQFLESKASYLSDSLHFYNFAAGASAEGIKVFAGASGYIHELNVSEGQYVELGQLLVTISSNKVLLLRADVPQQYFFLLDKIERANFRPAYTDKTYAVEDLEGKLLAKGSSVAENDHYMPVFFEVKNDGSLLEGAFAEFYLMTDEKVNSLVVPFDAVSEEQGYQYLYVQVSGESFTKRAVTIGENNGKSLEIRSGLHPGERVVTKGVMLLKAASMVTGATGHGHAH